MKTIADITKLVKESESTVRRKFNDLKNEYKESDIIDKRGRLTEKGEEILLQRLTVNDSFRQLNESQITVSDIQFYQKRIEHLESELSREREHSRELAEKFANLTEQAQQLHAGTLENQQKLIAPGDPDRKRWQFWKK